MIILQNFWITKSSDGTEMMVGETQERTEGGEGREEKKKVCVCV